MKKTLEKIVNSVKKHVKKAIAVGVTVAMLAGPVYAGRIKISAWNSGTPSSGPTAKLKHDGSNVPKVPTPSGSIGIYFKDGENKLKEKVIDVNDLNPEDMYAEINQGTPGDEYWAFDIPDMDDFEWKNIIAHRYGQDGVSDPNATPEDTVDVKYLDGKGWYQSGSFSISSGDYDRWKFEQFNHADLNRDKKVNLTDYAIFAYNFARTDPNCGADPNNLDDYSDTNRNGVVDNNDLGLFSDEWLWDADDPNTW